ncbi:hypothetical protein, partial [Ralstonia insidiosa]|uniref:hypothetical protein n=1 Tax=Ralstonia insidiosa TaxID=190721 RepID=UPI001AC00716
SPRILACSAPVGGAADEGNGMRRGDNAPVGQTCPLIDEVISTIDNAAERVLAEMDQESIPSATQNIVAEFMVDLVALTQGRQSLLERIRSANDELRTWGNDEYRQRADVEDERDALERKVSALEDEVADLKAELSDALSQIA